MGFTFKGNGSSSSGDVIATCEVGGKTIKAIATKFITSGETRHVVSIEGLGKPTIFGAAKFCAIVDMKDAIAKHFRDVGQID